MSQNSLRRYSYTTLLVALGLSLLFIDFFTKSYIYHIFPFYNSLGPSYHSPVDLNFFGIHLSITLVFNKGAAWGFFSRFQLSLILVRLVVILGIFFYLFFINKKRYIIFPLLLIIAGALGNVVDFFLYGCVIDFIQLNFWGYHFPVFNLADTWITMGVIWFFLVNLMHRKKSYA
ncbi:MAG: signal peptidase II [Chlamydiales bacterium]